MNSDNLLPSDQDCMVLAESVNIRLQELSDRYRRKWFVDLLIPESLHKDVLLMHQMIARHRKKDPRHTASEYKAVKTLAQWTLDENNKLTGQPAKKLVWKD